MGRAILFLGLVLVLIGGVLLLGEKYGVKNPLDVRFGGENWTFYFPPFLEKLARAACILVGLAL